MLCPCPGGAGGWMCQQHRRFVSLSVLTAWAGAGAGVEVGEERVQLIGAEQRIPAELPLQRSSCLTRRDWKHRVNNMQTERYAGLQLYVPRLSLHIQHTPDVSSAKLMPT